MIDFVHARAMGHKKLTKNQCHLTVEMYCSGEGYIFSGEGYILHTVRTVIKKWRKNGTIAKYWFLPTCENLEFSICLGYGAGWQDASLF